MRKLGDRWLVDPARSPRVEDDEEPCAQGLGFGRGRSVWCATVLVGLAVAVASAGQQPFRQRVHSGTAFVAEIEAVAATVAVSGGDVVVQPMAAFGPGWSGDAQLFWRATGPATTLAWDLQIPATGTWNLALDYTQAPDYARFAVQIDGRQVVELEGYGPTVARARADLGRLYLAAGAHRVVIAITGRHPSSTGWIVGLDRVQGAPTPGVARTPSVATPTASTRATTVFGPGRPRIEPEALGRLKPRARQPRLEARSWGEAGRRGLEERWDPRRIRLDWNGPDISATFRWLTPDGAAGAQWQVYSDPPPPTGRGELLASGPLPAATAGVWQEFSIDLTALAPPRLPDIALFATTSPAKIRPHLIVRVQPITVARRAPPKAASSQVQVKFSSAPIGKLKVPQSNLAISLVEARPVRPYDQRFLCWAVATRDGPPRGNFDLNHPKEPMWRRGDKRSDLCDHDDSGGILGFFEDFGSALAGAITSFVDTLGSAVDQASALYSEVKGGVLDIAGAPLASLGCGSPCESALSLALDAALVSAGVPPSLPDFEEAVQGLEDGGIDAVTDALVQTAVSQGIPADQMPLARDAARAAVEHLVDQAKQRAANGGSSASDGGWGPDLSRAYSPAVLVFEVRNDGEARSEQSILQLLHETPHRTDIALPLWQKLPVGGYESSLTRVPALEPGTSTRIALTLLPETDPHLWLDLYYGRSSLLPPQEHCYRDFHGQPAQIEACQARMKLRSDALYVTSFELNRTWGAMYAKRPSRFALRLFRFAEDGVEGLEATLTCDPGGLCRMTGGTP